jgi:hypothetical protein
LLASDPASTTVQKLVDQGDVLPASGAVISSNPYTMRYVPGGWAIETLTYGGLEVIESSTGAWLRQGDPFGVGQTIADLERSFDVDHSGRLVAILDLVDGEGIYDAVVAVDGHEVLGKFDPALPGLEPARRWVEFDVVRFDTQDRLVVAGFTQLVPFLTTIEYLAMRYDVGADGSLSHPEILLRTGQQIGGYYVSYVNAIYDNQLAVRSDGAFLAQVGLSATPGGPWKAAVILGDEILFASGDPAPAPGTTWGIIPGDAVDLNEKGDVAFFTSLFEGIDGWRAIVKNGEIVAEEGKPAPGLPGSRLVFVAGPHLVEDGRLLWYGGWTDAGGLFQRGIFVDQTLWLHEGVTPLEGDPGWKLAAALWYMDLSEDGSRVLFQTSGLGPDWGLYEATLDQWVDLGGGLAGSGPAPVASGSGVLEPWAPVSVEMTGGVPGGLAWLVLGLSPIDLPFLGGVLCPAPDVVFAGLPLDGSGAVSVGAAWPPVFPPGADLWWQFWSVDPGGPQGFAASNCLEVQVP